MASTSTTLSDFLRTNNPRVNNVRCRPGNNTTSMKSRWKQPRFIEDWVDFDCEAMRLIYGGLLQEVLVDQYDFELIQHPRNHPGRMICDERSFEGQVLLQWNYKMVEEALCQSQDRLLGRVARENIFIALGCQAELPTFDGDLKPDWASIQGEPADSFDTSKPRNILPGETKLSKKWSSSTIRKGEVKITYQKTNWLRPIAQLFTYCVQSGCRYGYIITDKELLAVRIRPAPQDDQDDSSFELKRNQSTQLVKESPTGCALRSGIMECKAIPWHFSESENPNQLTVNQAIWYLHMLAAENSGIEDHYQPLRHENCRRRADTVGETASSHIGMTKKRRRDEGTATSTCSHTREPCRKRRAPTSQNSSRNVSFMSI